MRHNRFWGKLIVQIISIVFGTILLTAIFVILFSLLLKLLHIYDLPIQRGTPMIAILLASACVAAIICAAIATLFLRPIEEITEATKEIAQGNFDIHIDTSVFKNKEGELYHLTENFNLMAKELKNNEMLKNDFISNVSHEFKTPLSTINGYVTLLQDDTLTKEERITYTNYILEATRQLSDLTSNILKLSKLENQEVSFEKTSFSIDEQTRECILFYERAWTEKDIDWDINLEEVNGYYSKDLLNQIWMNLIGNAIKFSKGGGKICVNLSVQENQLIWSIQDQGVGMTPEVQAHIFDKFYQGDSSHKKEGNGLGLAMVKKIVEIEKGKIQVESNLNIGSKFTIYLPYQEETLENNK